jgi:hypothetical protein
MALSIWQMSCCVGQQLASMNLILCLPVCGTVIPEVEVEFSGLGERYEIAAMLLRQRL